MQPAEAHPEPRASATKWSDKSPEADDEKRCFFGVWMGTAIPQIGILNDSHIIIYDGLSKCLFPVLLINRNSMRAASCLPLKNMTYLDDVKTWKFFLTFGNLSKTTGIG